MDDKNIEPLVKEYLSKVLYLKNFRNQVKKMELIGIELKNDLSTIYLEVPLSEGLKKGSLMQSALTEQFPEQLNIVNISYKGQVQSFVFKKNDREQVFKF